MSQLISTKRSIEKVNGAIKNDASKKSKSKPKLTDEELLVTVKKFVDHYETTRDNVCIENDWCTNAKDLDKRFQAAHMLLTLWEDAKFVDGDAKFTKKEIVEKCGASLPKDEDVVELMELAIDLEWIDDRVGLKELGEWVEPPENVFYIEFPTVFDALCHGYLDMVSVDWTSLKDIIGKVPDRLKKIYVWNESNKRNNIFYSPFFKLLESWDEVAYREKTPPQDLNELIELAVRYIDLEGDVYEVDHGLVRCLKDPKFKLHGAFTSVERDLVFYYAVEKYKVGAYHDDGAAWIAPKYCT
jgi:hypothetical protein